MKRYLLAFSIFLCTLTFAAQAAAVPVVFVNFDDNSTAPAGNLTVTSGDTFTVNVFAQGFIESSSGISDDHNGLVEFGIIAFDSPDAILQPTGSAVDLTFWTAPQQGSGTATSNSVIMAGIFTPPPLAPGNLTTFPLRLGSLTYEATGTGTSTITLLGRDALLNDFVAQDGFVFDALIDFQGATIVVQPVPLPGSGFLLGGGILGLLGLSRKRNRRR